MENKFFEVGIEGGRKERENVHLFCGDRIERKEKNFKFFLFAFTGWLGGRAGKWIGVIDFGWRCRLLMRRFVCGRQRVSSGAGEIFWKSFRWASRNRGIDVWCWFLIQIACHIFLAKKAESFYRKWEKQDDWLAVFGDDEHRTVEWLIINEFDCWSKRRRSTLECVLMTYCWGKRCPFVSMIFRLVLRLLLVCSQGLAYRPNSNIEPCAWRRKPLVNDPLVFLLSAFCWQGIRHRFHFDRRFFTFSSGTSRRKPCVGFFYRFHCRGRKTRSG